MFKKIFSASTQGLSTQLVSVEVDISYGMLQWNIVGLPDAAVKESKQRISSAIKNTGIKLPERKITINLAPADLKKAGSIYDLAMAVGILWSFDLLKISNEFVEETLFLGELALDGHIYPVNGILPIATDAIFLNKKRLIVPKENIKEILSINNIEIIGVSSLKELLDAFSGFIPMPICSAELYDKENENEYIDEEDDIDFEDVKGQEKAKRALQIAAIGGHNILMIGSPGSGKSMLAERLKTILPKMTHQESIEVSKIYSITGKIKGRGLIQKRPFRSPHHTISSAGLLGGGSYPTPGEISFAHHGILFLDELLEFKKSCLEDLRQPLENKTISISRAQISVEYPASFLLIAAMNPCPCGFYGSEDKECKCHQHEVHKYLSKLSGPLLDRIDLQIGLYNVPFKDLQDKNSIINSKTLYEGVLKGINFQQKNRKHQVIKNSLIKQKEIATTCILSPEANSFIEHIFHVLKLSARSYHKILKISRTIADLEEQEIIQLSHIKEAYQYRQLDVFLKK